MKERRMTEVWWGRESGTYGYVNEWEEGIGKVKNYKRHRIIYLEFLPIKLQNIFFIKNLNWDDLCNLSYKQERRWGFFTNQDIDNSDMDKSSKRLNGDGDPPDMRPHPHPAQGLIFRLIPVSIPVGDGNFSTSVKCTNRDKDSSPNTYGRRCAAYTYETYLSIYR